MAFKPIQLSDSVTFVSTDDPAVDRDRCIEDQLEKLPELRANESLSEESKRDRAWLIFVAEYCNTFAQKQGEALNMLHCKNGESFTRFVIGVIRNEDLNRLNDETRETGTHRGRWDEQRWRAFLHSVRDIQGWSSEVKKRKLGEVEYVDPGWASQTFIKGLRVIALEVGMAALAWNNLTAEEIENL